jgi:HSP20 family protein
MAPDRAPPGSNALTLLRARMNRLFDERVEPSEARLAAPFGPPADVYTTPEQVVVTVELPGIQRAQVAIEVDGGQLIVRGHRAFPDGAAYHLLERSYGEFGCRVALPADADPDSRQVRLEAGVLTIEMARRAS